MNLKRFIPIGIIIGVVAFIAITNYTPHTYLSGWDNLQTDLNPLLGIKRAWYSVWEEYQNLGLVAGMGHAADLLRAIFIWILSLVLPQSIVRYVFQMIMVAVGGIGIYKLLEHIEFNKEKKWFAVAGALFYILNIGSIQILFLPFEAFTIFFAMLPWQIWSYLRFVYDSQHSHPEFSSGSDFNKDKMLKQVQHDNKNVWITFFLINLLATPYGVAQQLFVVYLLLLGLITFGLLIQNHSINLVKTGVIALFVILAINSFWLLPQLYFLKTSSAVVRESKINQMATEDVFYSNLEKGTIGNFIKLEGFFYDRLGRMGTPLFDAWKDYRAQAPINFLVILFALIPFIGMLKNSRYRLPFILCYTLMVFGLLTNTFPINVINNVVRSNSFINQVFRSPFTKFIIPYSLVTTYFFTYGIYAVYESYNKYVSKKLTIYPLNFAAIIGLLICIYSFPAFNGQYLSSEMKVSIPQDYFKVMEYFKHEDKNKRIALLPEYTFWGWYFTSWGYNGSGFWWYGIEQPILSRNFDMWSFKGENYFWEMKQASEAEDKDAFKKVLQKYNISYIILDRSLQPVVTTTKGLQIDRLESLLQSSTDFNLVIKGKYVSLYKVRTNYKTKDFVSVSSPLPNIGPLVNVTQDDTAYKENSLYKTTTSLPYDMYYPYLDFFSQTSITNKQWQISETNNTIKVTTTIPESIKYYSLSSSGSLADNVIDTGSQVQNTKTLVKHIKNNNEIVSLFNKNAVATIIPRDTTIYNCGSDDGDGEWEYKGNSITLESYNNYIACFGYALPTLSQGDAYLVKIKNKNISGRRLYFYVLDTTKKQNLLEDRLQSDTQYYILHPRYQYGVGYNLNFHNNSYNGIPSINELESIEIYTLPYKEIKDLKLINPHYSSKPVVLHSNFEAKKQNYYSYSVKTNTNDSAVILNQTFSDGWVAYETTTNISKILPFIFGTQIKEHFVVNNWANGWNTTGRNIAIVFWPQYLQYFGFLILLLSGTIIFFKNHKS